MRYRIVCTTQEPAWQDHDHASIKEVGTGQDPGRADKRWSVQEVVDAIGRGDTFYTQGIDSGKVAEVHTVRCARCSAYRIRSAPDATTDNNLDSLRRCNWN